MTKHAFRIAFLHLAPMSGDVASNRRLVETAVVTAAGLGAHWVITPELCISGYEFADLIGTEWISPQPDLWMTDLCRLAARLRVAVFLSHPERDRETDKLYNTVFVISADGTIAGKQRKINTLRGGAESWSSPGEWLAPVPVHPLSGIGILICADAYSPRIAQSLKAQGAQLLVAAAAWGPSLYGPDGEWERCSRDTGLALLVCNRTGTDRTLSFTGAESVVVKDGRRILSFASEQSAIFTVEWDLKTHSLATLEYQTVYL